MPELSEAEKRVLVDMLTECVASRRDHLGTDNDHYREAAVLLAKIEEALFN